MKFISVSDFKYELDGIFSGLLISVTISIISQFASKYIPHMGAALIAIFLGIILGNSILTSNKFEKGTKFSEKRLLEYSIILNGLILDAVVMKQAGVKGFLFLIINMIATIIIAYSISRLFKFGKKFSLLMAAGNAVCGSSAIGTVSPIIKADGKDKGISITSVNILGTVLMILLPIISAILYHSETIHTSALIGGTVQSIGQVIASAELVNHSVVELSTVFKLIRVMLIVVIALVFEKLNTDEDEALFLSKASKNISNSENSALNSAETTKPAIKLNIPWFIYGFILFFMLRSAGVVPESIIHFAKLISAQFEIAALAAIGLRVKFSDIVKEGPKAMLCTLIIGVAQVGLAIALIKLML